MGPRLFSVDDPRGCGYRDWCVSASMGPRLFSVDDETCFVIIGGLSRASMGPRLFSVDDSRSKAAQRRLVRLQWGHACSAWMTSMAGEATREAFNRFNGATLVQRG